MKVLGRQRGSHPPQPPTPGCSACIFNTYLILFQMEGKKNGKEKVPEALKGFHCSEHLGGWLSGEVVGGGHSGTQSHWRNFPSRPLPVMERVPVGGGGPLRQGCPGRDADGGGSPRRKKPRAKLSLGVLRPLLPFPVVRIPNHLLCALPPAGEQGDSSAEG